jgi:hypothetical protein
LRTATLSTNLHHLWISMKKLPAFMVMPPSRLSGKLWMKEHRYSLAPRPVPP